MDCGEMEVMQFLIRKRIDEGHSRTGYEDTEAE